MPENQKISFFCSWGRRPMASLASKITIRSVFCAAFLLTNTLLVSCKSRTYNDSVANDVRMLREKGWYRLEMNLDSDYVLSLCKDEKDNACNVASVKVSHKEFQESFRGAMLIVIEKLHQRQNIGKISLDDRAVDLKSEDLLSRVKKLEVDRKKRKFQLKVGELFPTFFKPLGREYVSMTNRLEAAKDLVAEDSQKKETEVAEQRRMMNAVNTYVQGFASYFVESISDSQSLLVHHTRRGENADSNSAYNQEFESAFTNYVMPPNADLPKNLPTAEDIGELLLSYALKGLFAKIDEVEGDARKQRLLEADTKMIAERTFAQKNLVAQGLVQHKIFLKCTPIFIVSGQRKGGYTTNNVETLVEKLAVEVVNDWKQASEATLKDLPSCQEFAADFAFKLTARQTSEVHQAYLDLLEGPMVHRIERFSRFHIDEWNEFCVKNGADSEIQAKSGWKVCL